MGSFPALEDIESIKVTLLIPALIKNLVPAKETIEMRLEMQTVFLSKELKSIIAKECPCYKMANRNNSDVIEWHVCVTQFLIGLWTNGRTIVYFSHHVSMLDIQANLERFGLQF